MSFIYNPVHKVWRNLLEKICYSTYFINSSGIVCRMQIFYKPAIKACKSFGNDYTNCAEIIKY